MIGRIDRSRIDDDLTAEVLYEEPFHVVVGARNPLADRRKVTLAALMNERWMISESNNVVTSLVSGVFRANGFEFPRASVFTASTSLFLPLLASGRYITVLPNSVLRYSAEHWSLKILPIDLEIISPVGIFTLKNRTLSPVVQLFAEEARLEARTLTEGVEP